MIARMRAEAAHLRAKADRLDSAILLLEDEDAPAPIARRPGRKPGRKAVTKPAKKKPGRKPGRRGETANPPAEKDGGKVTTRRRVSDLLEKHPEATAKEIAEMLNMNVTTIAYHLTQLRRA